MEFLLWQWHCIWPRSPCLQSPWRCFPLRGITEFVWFSSVWPGWGWWSWLLLRSLRFLVMLWYVLKSLVVVVDHSNQINTINRVKYKHTLIFKCDTVFLEFIEHSKSSKFTVHFSPPSYLKMLDLSLIPTYFHSEIIGFI